MRVLWALAAVIAIGGIAAASNSQKRLAGETGWRDSFDVRKPDLLPHGNNPYITMQPGRVLKLRHGNDTLTVTVLPDITDVDGIKAGVLEERETKGGKLVEVSRNFLATDTNTQDVYYFGEDVDNYKNGKVIDHESAWHAGERGARFGLMIPAKPAVGQRFYQEIAPKVAMDRVEVVSIDDTVKTPAGIPRQGAVPEQLGASGEIGLRPSGCANGTVWHVRVTGCPIFIFVLMYSLYSTN